MIKIILSVHELVDFVLRKGDIDTRVFNSTTMQEGTRLHSIYQSAQSGFYLKEVPLSYSFIYGDYVITLQGRCDGIFKESDDHYVIEEIKTTNIDLNEFHEKNELWHLGQAICYAYIYLKEKELKDIGIQLTYISQNDGEKLFKKYYLSEDELLSKIHDYFRVYLDFKNVLIDIEKERTKSLKDFPFPFPYQRSGQKEIMDAVTSAIKDHDYYFVEASTGIGKTMSVLYPTLEPLRKNQIEKIFYLTSKNSGFINSINALNKLYDSGAKIKAVEIIAKEKMCPHHGTKNCNPLDCPLAEGYYDKISVALKDILRSEYVITTKVLKDYSKKYRICPFEFSLDISSYADYIVCDYNYVFHPIAALKRFFVFFDRQYRMFALIDEIHNMVDRGREMFNVTLFSSQFNEMSKTLKEVADKRLRKDLISLKKHFKAFEDFDFSEQNEFVIENLDEEFILSLQSFDKDLKKYEQLNPYFKSDEVDAFSLESYKFLRIYEFLNDEFKIILKLEEKGISLSIMCFNPAPFLNQRLLNLEGMVGFSATLKPIEYYMKSIFGRDNFKNISLESSFDKNNLKILVNNTLSLKYKDRLLSYSEIKAEINTFINFRTGNYMIYVPSFEYLNLLKRTYIADDRFIFQEKRMTNDSKKEFLDNFIENPLETKVGVCVVGGTFSEGIDLVGDRLIGAIVIGVGMPSISFENNLIKDYFEEKYGNGFEYAYVNPGICKVMQAIGRVIRTESDKGAVLLIDSRYTHSNYKKIFTSKWDNFTLIKNAYDLENELNIFYKKQ